MALVTATPNYVLGGRNPSGANTQPAAGLPPKNRQHLLPPSGYIGQDWGPWKISADLFGFLRNIGPSGFNSSCIVKSTDGGLNWTYDNSLDTRSANAYEDDGNNIARRRPGTSAIETGGGYTHGIGLQFWQATNRYNLSSFEGFKIATNDPQTESLHPPALVRLSDGRRAFFYYKNGGYLVKLQFFTDSSTDGPYDITPDHTSIFGEWIIAGLNVDSADRMHMFVYTTQEDSAILYYIQIAPDGTASAPVQLDQQNDSGNYVWWDGGAVVIYGDTVRFPCIPRKSASFHDVANADSVIEFVGTGLASPTFSVNVIRDVADVPAGRLPFFVQFGLGCRDVIALWWEGRTFFGEGDPADLIRISRFNGTSWSTSVVFFDELANPTPAPPEPGSMTGQSIQDLSPPIQMSDGTIACFVHIFYDAVFGFSQPGTACFYIRTEPNPSDCTQATPIIMPEYHHPRFGRGA